MKFYVKERVWSLKEKFDIFDEGGNVRYYVEGKFFSINNQFTLFDVLGRELYQINQDMFTLLPRFSLLKNGQVVEKNKKKFTLFNHEFIIGELNWRICGDVYSHNFEINDGNNTIAFIRKKWFTIGDSYEFDIIDTSNIELVLAIIIMIDKVIDYRNDN